MASLGGGGGGGAVDPPVTDDVGQLFEEDVDDGAGQEGGGRLRDGVVAQTALDQPLGEGGGPAELGQVLQVDGVLEEEGDGGREQTELQLQEFIVYMMDLCSNCNEISH